MKHLVTVTCPRDRQHMLLQAESLKYLEDAITHHVIIDADTDITVWQQLLSPYYTRHTLDLSLGAQLNPTWATHGWRRQQVYKLLAWNRVQDDYLIIDSQNFFIRPCTLAPWAGIQGMGIWNDKINDYPDRILDPIAEITMHSHMTYSRHLAQPICRSVASDGVPFVILKEVMSAYDIDQLMTEFQQLDCQPVEFVFYNLLAQKIGFQGRMLDRALHSLVRDPTSPFPELSWNVDRCLLAGIHRTFVNFPRRQGRLPVNRRRVNEWLADWGFNNRF